MMKNVLLIAHLPRATPRIEGLVRYLPEFGWQPIILTGATSRYKDLPAKIVETPYKDALGFLGRWFNIEPENEAGQQIRDHLGVTSGKSPLDFFLNLGGSIINYPCSDKNWKPFAIEAAVKLFRHEKIDAMISSSAPVISHVIATELKKGYNVPWIADFRDLWSQNHNYSYGPVRRMMDRKLEIKTLANADALVTASVPWAEKLTALHKEKRIYTIVHGYNPAEVNDPPAELADKFTITYTGIIYPGKQTPSRFFIALQDLLSDSTIRTNDIEVRFYGPVEEWLTREIEKHELSGVVKQYGRVSREVSVEKQRESQILLFLNWDDPQEKGVYSGKIFEYLGARRPILSTGGSDNDVVEELLIETRAGISAITETDIRNTLKEMYIEYKARGSVHFKGDLAKISIFTHSVMAGKFAGILDNLI